MRFAHVFILDFIAVIIFFSIVNIYRYLFLNIIAAECLRYKMFPEFLDNV